jgi:cobalt/nickel transport protein
MSANTTNYERGVQRRKVVMACMPKFAAIVAMSAGTCAPVFAQHHILTLNKHSVAPEEAVTCSLRFGRSFEHHMLAAQKPARVTVRAPDGTTTDVTPKLDRIEQAAADGREIVSFQWKYTPALPGDYLFTVQANPLWMPDEGEYVVDAVKVILHVQAQNGWEAAAGMPLELIPLTRPYGLRSWLTFQALVLGNSDQLPNGKRGPEMRPLPGTHVAVERLSPAPPKELPPPEHVTRTVRTDPVGVATATLTDGGWWSLTAVRDGGTRERAGRAVPVRLRSTLWVYVDENVPLAPVK